jgi:ATP-dependent DNA helicase RecQ
MSEDVLIDVLRTRFGFDRFRPGQREVIQAVLDGQDLLVVQPTGHGKSLLYQVPAVLLGGLVLVISPLLALMRDQLDHLATRFQIAAGSLNSDQEEQDNEAVRARAARGELSVLFVSPEQLDNVERLNFLVGLRPVMVVIDEAHCISTWGHDFRPAYRQIAPLVAHLRRARPVRVLALTATADSRTEADIAGQLAPVSVVRHAMDRPNLSLSVVSLSGLPAKLALLDELAKSWEGCGLLYCATRESTEIVADYLRARGHAAAAYHAGLPPERKQELQRAFLGGAFRAIAATNALGMGIDKADLRYVVHVETPGSITACYQEVGRAGRDGAPARGLLLFDPDDLQIQEHFIASAQPQASDFELLQRLVQQEPQRLTDLKRLSGLHPTRVTVVLAELVEQGLLAREVQKRTQFYVPGPTTGAPDLSRYRTQEQVRRQGLQHMVSYAKAEAGCLMRTLRTALGDPDSAPCGRCGPCTGATPPSASPEALELAATWLQGRPVGVPGFVRHKLDDGFAVFDSQHRSAGFRAFMQGRKEAPLGGPALERLCAMGQQLATTRVSAVVPLPSQSWAGRSAVAQAVAQAVGAPVVDVLEWRERPAARQGELTNNDQRQANVQDKMSARGSVPRGRVLLLDDYTGSGATLREAARVLRREQGHEGALVPLTVARVRWRIGRPGIV